MAAIEKLLIANRGEIACRVITTAQAKGYRTVAVYSDADVDARHVAMADEAVRIGPSPVGESYLDAERILAAARHTGANAIHPGYGFLSERAAFAEACAQAGIIFVGPPVEAIRIMGDKAASKQRMIAAGIPCVLGYHGDAQDEETLAAEAARIGYPVMVKASAGGGGRGMRIVFEADNLVASLRTARSEAQAAFGDGRLLLERAVIGPRHVEIQVFGDMHGSVVHLGERDCSVQRRHQKVVEEAPSPAVDPGLRARMGAAAVQAAASIGYVGAGTVEFLLTPEGEFYFLEMNTRLQVEHPVTELVTGLDLVGLQLDVAEGKALPFDQDDIQLNGHAMEVRLYAEDPSGGFLPQTGLVRHWNPATGDGVRVDHGLREPAVVSPHYDPMLAKIIAYGSDRTEARRRLVRAVEETRIHGITTNRAFLVSILNNQVFADGAATTAFIAEQYPEGFITPPTPALCYALAACLLTDRDAAGWSSNGWASSPILLNGPAGERRCLARRDGAGWNIDVDGEAFRIALLDKSGTMLRFAVDGHVRPIGYALNADGQAVELDLHGAVHRFTDVTLRPVDSADNIVGSGAVTAPMNGLVVSVMVETGQAVKRGDLLLVLEAMKMEHQISAPIDGVVEQVAVVRGAQIAMRDVLVVVNAGEGE